MADDPLGRAVRYGSRGWWRACRRTSRTQLRKRPDDPTALALLARCEAELGALPWAQAERQVRALVAQHPDLVGLQIAAAGVVYRSGRTEGALAELRSMAERHPDNAKVREAYAGLLGCRRETWPDAWQQYQAALHISGSLTTSGYRAAAYKLGRELDSEAAAAALAGASRVERAAIRTRTLHRPWPTAPVIAGLVGVMLASYAAVVAAVVVGVSTLWALWVIGTLVYVRMCRLCLTAWLLIIACLWLVYALAVTGRHGPQWAAYVAGGILLSEVVIRGHRRLERRVVATDEAASARVT